MLVLYQSLILFACLSLEIAPQHVKRTIDGDTFVLYHVGVPPEERIRVLAIDTPERGQFGFEAAKAFTTEWLATGPFSIYTCKRDSFGRYLAVVSRNESILADTLVSLGLGVRP